MKMKKMKKIRALAFTVVVDAVAMLGMMVLPATDVMAQAARPCAQDVQKFCSGVQQGQGGAAKCLKEHESELSTACRERITIAKERNTEVHQACQNDVKEFCSGVQTGGGLIAKCLQENSSKLSPGCHKVIGNAQQMKMQSQ